VGGEHVIVNDVYRSPVVIAADGANSRTRALLYERRAPDNHAAFAVRGYAKAAVDALEIRWERNLFPAYSWVFPIGDGRVNIGFGCLHDRLTSSRPKEQLWAALGESVTFEPIPGTLRAHRLPLTSARLSRSHGRVLFSGDASGMINPLSGEGIYYALATGRLAGSTAALASEDVADTYENAVRKLFGRHFRSTNWAHRLQRLPRNIDASVVAAERSFEVFEDLVELALGRGGLTPAIVRGVAKGWMGSI
jgi:flavin-dependent dehydrogenase